ncbi:MAG TPA: hypothetical protein VGO80_07285 [Solirubrobacteraceae bacterium]|nr:hypothetical protein [Solirubrobacteraceae bacterium]
MALCGERLSVDEVLKTARCLEMRCEECPQSGVDMAPRRPDGGEG